jgi:lipoprotein-anchoring transpeptidase ErfK/SrfK
VLGSRFQRCARLTAVALVGLSALAACSKGDDDEADKKDKTEESRGRTRRPSEGDATATTIPAPAARSYVATAALPEVAVYPTPDAAEPLETFQNPYKPETPLVFLVDGTEVSGEWLPVYAPTKPNGVKGFVKATDVTVAPNPYWVKIEMAAHHILVTKNDEVVVDTQVGVGDQAKDWDTPTGVFFITNLIKNEGGSPAYGPYAYGLSAFSENPEVVNQFGNGGQVGLHGTDDPSSIGQSVSHGCIRVNNDVITQLAGLLPLGTPVEIIA